MSEVSAGIVGALLGAFVAGVITFWIQRRREQREAKAARVIVELELDEAAEVVRAIERSKGWPPGWMRAWSQSWATNRPALALDMPDRSFKKLADAYLFMGRLEAGLAAGQRPLVESDEPFLTEESARLEPARAVVWTRRRGWFERG